MKNSSSGYFIIWLLIKTSIKKAPRTKSLPKHAHVSAAACPAWRFRQNGSSTSPHPSLEIKKYILIYTRNRTKSSIKADQTVIFFHLF